MNKKQYVIVHVGSHLSDLSIVNNTSYSTLEDAIDIVVLDFYVATQGDINNCLSDTYIGNCIPDELLNPVLKFIEDNKEHLMQELKIPKYAVGKTEEHENSGFGMWTVPSGYAPPQGFARNPRYYDEPEHRLGARLSEFKDIFGEESNINKPITSMNTHSHDIPTQPISGKRNRNRLGF